MPPTALAVRETPAGGALAMWDSEQLDVIKSLICPGATNSELALFGQVCQKTGLDPFSRQIYGIMRAQRQQVNGEWKTVEKLSIQTSIDGFRLIAERSGKYGGQLGPQWCGEDGRWRDVWLPREYPSAARVGVLRTDWKEPLWAVARWDSYVQTHRDRKTQQDVVGTMWQRMPDVMLAKVAESLALRRAFPAELSGLYTSEEMGQADKEQAPSAAPAQLRVVTGDVVDEPPPTPEPADAETRAKFDEQWKRACTAAIELGVAIGDTPPPEATKRQLNVAQREIVEAIRAREKLNAEFKSLFDQVKTAGGDPADVDVAKATDQELHEMIGTLREMLGAVPDDDSDAPF